MSIESRLEEANGLEFENQHLRHALQVALGHSNCYCDECQELAAKFYLADAKVSHVGIGFYDLRELRKKVICDPQPDS